MLEMLANFLLRMARLIGPGRLIVLRILPIPKGLSVSGFGFCVPVELSDYTSHIHSYTEEPTSITFTMVLRRKD